MNDKQQFKYIPRNQVEREPLNDKIDREMVVGDKVIVTVVRVDMQRRELDFRVKGGRERPANGRPEHHGERPRRGKRH